MTSSLTPNEGIDTQIILLFNSVDYDLPSKSEKPLATSIQAAMLTEAVSIPDDAPQSPLIPVTRKIGAHLDAVSSLGDVSHHTLRTDIPYIPRSIIEAVSGSKLYFP